MYATVSLLIIIINQVSDALQKTPFDARTAVPMVEISPLAGPFLAADRVHGGSGVLDVLVTLDRDVGSPTTTKPVW